MKIAIIAILDMKWKNAYHKLLELSKLKKL